MGGFPIDDQITLVQDATVHFLLMSNDNRLSHLQGYVSLLCRKELNVQSSLSEQYEDKARDLANMLDSSKNKVQVSLGRKVQAFAL